LAMGDRWLTLGLTGMAEHLRIFSPEYLCFFSSEK
jgi:hypothetical protein